MNERTEIADRRWALALLGLALALRAVTAANLPVVSQDAQAYLGFARDIKVGVWSDWLRGAIGPLYPILIVLADTWIHNDILSAHIVSVLFSSLGVLPLFAFVRDMCGRRPAILTVLFYSVLPRILFVQPDIFTDGLFHFLFLTTVALLWHGITRASTLAFSLAGFTAGLAFYTRTEGIYLAAASVGLPLIALLLVPRRGSQCPDGRGGAPPERRETEPYQEVGPRERNAAGGDASSARWVLNSAERYLDRKNAFWSRMANAARGCLAAAIFLLVCSPLFLWWRSQYGDWTLTPKGSAAAARWALGDDDEEGPMTEWGGPRSWPAALSQFQKKIRTVGQEIVPILALCSLPFLRRQIRLLGGIFLLCLFLGYSFPLLAAFVGGYPMVKRYLLLPLLFLLPFASLGIFGIVESLSRMFPPRRVRLCASVFLGILLAAGGVYGTLPKRSRQRTVVEAARWLQGRLQSASTIYTNSPRVQPYVHAKVVQFNSAGWQAIELQEMDYMVVIEQRLEEQAPGALAYLRSRYDRVARFPEAPPVDDKLYRVSVFARPLRH